MEHKPNRTRVKQPHGHGHWCWGCDKAFIRDGQKCPVCGSTQEPKRFKKLIPTEGERE